MKQRTRDQMQYYDQRVISMALKEVLLIKDVYSAQAATVVDLWCDESPSQSQSLKMFLESYRTSQLCAVGRTFFHSLPLEMLVHKNT